MPSVGRHWLAWPAWPHFYTFFRSRDWSQTLRAVLASFLIYFRAEQSITQFGRSDILGQSWTKLGSGWRPWPWPQALAGGQRPWPGGPYFFSTKMETKQLFRFSEGVADPPPARNANLGSDHRPNKKKRFLLGGGGRLPPSENKKAGLFLFGKKKVQASGQGCRPGPGPPARPAARARASRHCLAWSKTGPNMSVRAKIIKNGPKGSRIDGLA